LFRPSVPIRILSVSMARQSVAEDAVDPLAEEQYSLFSEGSLHAKSMVQLSRAARRGGYEKSTTSDIAKAKLTHANEKVMSKAEKLVDTYEILIPLDVSETERKEVPCPCLNMYEVFGALFLAGPLQFTVALLGSGGEENLESFWGAASRSDIFKDHPVLLESWAQLCLMVPVLLFYDGADIFRDKEFLWWLWSSAVSDSNDWDCEFPLLCIDHALIRTTETLRLVMKRVTEWIKWNLEALRKGVGPDKGFHGEDLKTSSMKYFANKLIAGPFRACFVGATGDFKSRMEWMGFSRYYLCRFLCECCLGQSPSARANKLFTCYDFNWNANWTLTCITTQQLQETEDHELPLCSLEGYNNELYHRDVMHTKLLGDAKDSLASGIISMVEMNLLGDGTPDQQLDRLHEELDDYCIDVGIRKVSAPRLSLRCLGRKDSSLCFPELSTYWKAAATNTLIHFLAFKAEKVCRRTGTEKLIAVHLWALAEFMYVIAHADIELTDLEQRRALHSGRLFLLTICSAMFGLRSAGFRGFLKVLSIA